MMESYALCRNGVWERWDRLLTHSLGLMGKIQRPRSPRVYDTKGFPMCTRDKKGMGFFLRYQIGIIVSFRGYLTETVN